MPNRIIKESTFLSDRIASLSDFEFRLWVGLITQADDAGRGDARPAIIKGHIFALRERVTIKDIDNALHALAAAGCVFLYTVDGKPYYAFPSWAAHQRIRDVKPKYPAPEETGEVTTCGELPQIAADCRLNPNPNTNTNTNTSGNTHARVQEKFVPPTVEEVKAYCKERKNNVNAEHFVNYYTASDWKNVADWKAKVRSWETNGIDKANVTKAGTKTASSFTVDEAVKKALQRTYKEK